MINSQFFKEFGYRPNSKSVDEKMEAREDRAFYESIGYEFIRKVIPSIVSQK
jgi:predicted lactoylglutathione lyase